MALVSLPDWNYSLILDYLRVLVWPLVVTGFLAYLLARFGSHIGPLIDRIKSLKVPGAEFGFAERTQEQALGDEEAAEESLEDENELIAEVEAAYEARLEEQALEAAEERRELVRRLVVIQLQLDYERIYRVIYQSQIAALRSMRASPAGVPRLALEAHLNQAKATWPLVAWLQALTFEQWIGFLLNSQLVVDPLGNETYKITTRGEGFLDYIDAGQYPLRFF